MEHTVVPSNQEEMVVDQAEQGQVDVPEPGVEAEEPAEPQPQPEERTLTDHLNKKLLESFMSKLESGGLELPPGAQGPMEEEGEDDQEFAD